MNIQKLFKQYIVRRKKGQCQILIPLIELDELCNEIEKLYLKRNKPPKGKQPPVNSNVRRLLNNEDY